MSDRDRLLLQFDVFRTAFRVAFDQALDVSRVNRQQRFRVLDVACGEGLYAADASERYQAALVVGLDHPHPSATILSKAVVDAGSGFGTYAAGDRHVTMLAETGFEQIETVPQNHPLGGNTAADQTNFVNVVQLRVSMRTSLVERAKVISARQFDEHWSKFSDANNALTEGM